MKSLDDAPSYPEDLPAQSALATDEYPGELPEAGSGHVTSTDGEGAPVADCDVAL